MIDIAQRWLALVFLGGCLAAGDAGPTSMPGQHEIRIEHDGLDRLVLLEVPPDYPEDTTERPLVIVLHGAGAGAIEFRPRRDELVHGAGEIGWLVAFPDGLLNNNNDHVWRWSDDDFGTWPGGDPDDEGFLLAVIDAIVDGFRIDPARVYLTGFSNGGRLTHHMASKHPERLAAVAVVSTSIAALVDGTSFTTADPTRPLPVLIGHGSNDPKVPWGGDAVVSSVQDALERWVRANDCDVPAPREALPNGEAWIERFVCRNADLHLAAFDTEDHLWPDPNDNADWNASHGVIEFFADIAW